MNSNIFRRSLDGRAIAVGFFAAASLALATVFIANATTPITEGYQTSERLPVGAIVSLQTNSADKVEASTIANVDNILGVVINTENSLLAVTNGQSNEAQIATNGTAPVLVSDINGDILKGDHITASQIAGVGMKATGNVRIVGIAQSKMTGGEKQTYKDKSGASHSVTIGQVPALINVSYFFKQPEKTVIPSALQNVANALAGRSVSTLPILVSLGIFLVTIIVVVSIIYSMIRSSIISIGRNPMSQSAVYRDLIQMSALVLGILTIGLVSIYLVLTRL
jgi:hypothetical protein